MHRPRTLLPFRCGSSLAVGLAVFGGLASAHQAPWPAEPEDQAWTLIRRVFADPFPMDAVAIQKRLATDASSPMTAKLVVTKGRHIISRVLEPLPMQGHTVWDNGDMLKFYNPDWKVVYKQASPNSYRPPIRQRMDWARANYTAKVEGTVKVAGREGYSVILTPRFDEMPKRRMTVDREYPFLLRNERKGRRGWIVSVNTVAVKFEDTDDDEVTFPDDVKTVTEWGPKPIRDYTTESMTQTLGFAPVSPEEIPFGFHVVATHAVGSAWENACVAYRLSDGIASMTVYAWVPSHSPNGPLKPSTTIMATSPEGVRYSALGEVPSEILQKVARAFAQGEGSTWERAESDSPLSPLREISSRRSTIPPTDHHEKAD